MKVTREHALKSSVETLRDSNDKGESSRLKLKEIHDVLSFK